MMKMINNRSLNLKLSLIISLSIVVLLGLVVATLNHSIESLTRQTAQRRLAEETQLIRAQLQRNQEELEIVAGFLADAPGLVEAVATMNAARLRSAVLTSTRNLDLDDVDVVDVNGNRLLTISGGGVSYDEGEEDALIALSLLGISTTKLIVEADDDIVELALATVAPLKDTSGAVVGGLLVSQEINEAFLAGLNFAREGIHLGVIRDHQIVSRYVVHSGNADNSGEHNESADEHQSADLAPGIAPDPAAVEQALNGEPVIVADILFSQDQVPHAAAYVPLMSGGSDSAAVVFILLQLDDLFVFHNDTLNNTVTIFIVVALLTLAASLFFIRLTAIKPLQRLKSVAESMAGGDYAARVSLVSSDEIGQLGRTIDDMAAAIQQRIQVESEQRGLLEQANQEIETRAGSEQEQRQYLQELLRQIEEVISTLNASALEIQAAAAQQLSNTTQQDVVVNETVVAVEEVRATVAQMAQHAQSVAETSQESVTFSRQGQNAVRDTIDGMDVVRQRVEDIAHTILALSERTQQIGEIIETVNALADQSKLLALNASIEAARAGEEGKGFAVVALEVRQLAEQSREATARVQVILTEIQQATNTAVMVTEEGNKGAEAGMTVVEGAGEAIRTLAAMLEEASEAATQIAASIRQQTNGMDQLSAAMIEIREASTQTAASTRQTENSIQSVINKVNLLEDFMASYEM